MNNTGNADKNSWHSQRVVPKDNLVKAEFTPGPWMFDPSTQYVFAANGQMTVCTIRGWGYLTGSGALSLKDVEAIAIQEANGRLIAAAPALYEAARFALSVLNANPIEMSERMAIDGLTGALTMASGQVASGREDEDLAWT